MNPFICLTHVLWLPQTSGWESSWPKVGVGWVASSSDKRVVIKSSRLWMTLSVERHAKRYEWQCHDSSCWSVWLHLRSTGRINIKGKPLPQRGHGLPGVPLDTSQLLPYGKLLPALLLPCWWEHLLCCSCCCCSHHLSPCWEPASPAFLYTLRPVALQESYRTSTPAWWTEFCFSLSKHEDIEGHRWVNVGGHCWEMAIIGLSSCNHVKQSTKVPFVMLSD